MKLQISYDFVELGKALEVAKQTAEFADILEVGALLLLSNGIAAAYEFKKEFPEKKIMVDAKLVDRMSEAMPMIAKSAGDTVSVLGGTSNHVIRNACKLAHENDMTVMLDLLDTLDMGQMAQDAKALGVDTLLFHRAHDDPEETSRSLDMWENVRGNTELPIYIAGKVSDENIENMLILKPDGLIIGTAITRSENPAEMAQHFREIIDGR